jgi:hypothetical protein
MLPNSAIDKKRSCHHSWAHSFGLKNSLGGLSLAVNRFKHQPSLAESQYRFGVLELAE